MGQYCFVGCRLSSSVTPAYGSVGTRRGNADGGRAGESPGAWAVDPSCWASRVTSR